MMLVGAILLESEEYRRIQHSAAAFQQRRGIIPIDWLLWKLADELFHAAFGTNPRLGQLAAHYRRTSLQSRIAALERVKAKVAAEVSALAAQSRTEAVALPASPLRRVRPAGPEIQ